MLSGCGACLISLIAPVRPHATLICWKNFTFMPRCANAMDCQEDVKCTVENYGKVRCSSYSTGVRFFPAGDVGKISAAAHFLAMITGSPLVLCIFSSECERSEQ